MAYQKKHRHLLAEVWENYPVALSDKLVPDQPKMAIDHFMDMMSVGSCYYYIINVGDYSLQQVSERALGIHGLKDYPHTLQQIIDLIHPDDVDFVLRAEEATLIKMNEIGFEHQLHLKTSYCFRMRVADGSYHLFHHQAIHLSKDDEGRLTTALNIHTDIQPITQTNNYIVLVAGTGKRNDYCQIDLSVQHTNLSIPKLSKREMEVLPLIAKGLSSKQIGEQLFISPETVRMHRKNLLRKTRTNGSAMLIKQCIEWGLI